MVDVDVHNMAHNLNALAAPVEKLERGPFKLIPLARVPLPLPVGVKSFKRACVCGSG